MSLEQVSWDTPFRCDVMFFDWQIRYRDSPRFVKVGLTEQPVRSDDGTL